jgi:hypothetical protein
MLHGMSSIAAIMCAVCCLAVTGVRTASVRRKTNETSISVDIDLDGTGKVTTCTSTTTTYYYHTGDITTVRVDARAVSCVFTRAFQDTRINQLSMVLL